MGQRAEGRGQGAGLWQPLKDLKPAAARSELSFGERQQDQVGCRERNQDEGSVDSGKTWSVLFLLREAESWNHQLWVVTWAREPGFSWPCWAGPPSQPISGK